MNNINYDFFDEYKKLEKLCNEMYNAHNGVTLYIDNMASVPYSNYCNIPNWESDLNQLKRLRHIRNNLAHVEGAFHETICTQNDIEWVIAFYKRILNQSDPLAMQHQIGKRRVQNAVKVANTHAQKAVIITNTNSQKTSTNSINDSFYNQTNTKEKASLATSIILLTIIGTLVTLILFLMK